MMKERDYADELIKCVRCGGCKASCPTYDEGLTEAMGARGRLTLLRGLLSGELDPSPLLRDRIFSCILCGACETLCPLGVHVTGAVYHARKMLAPLTPGSKYLRHVLRFSARRPMTSFRVARALSHFGVTPERLLGTFGTAGRRKQGKEKKAAARTAALPFRLVIPEAPLREHPQVYKPERKTGRVALFTGCATNYLYPRLGMSLINVLLKIGYEVVLPAGEVCCGAPFRSLGLEDDAVELAKKNVATFSKLNAEAVLSLCPTCIVSLKTQYQELTGKGVENAMDVSRFLLDKLGTQDISPLQRIGSATFHDPCHLKYSLGITKEPRELVLHTGVELREAKGGGCCGFGGIFSLQNRELSISLRDKRAGVYLGTGADAVVTACPGCMMQLEKGVEDRPVLHVVELVEEALCGPRGNRGGTS